MKTLDKYYDHLLVEEKKMERWESLGFFKADVSSKKPPFTVIIPPPNVTGILHIGHAKNIITIDTLCRYKKLRGYDVLFAPGTDHAGIATQAKVEALLKGEGVNKYQLGREKFLDRVWKFKESSADYINNQWRFMGLSLDYDRERFTLDELTTKAVNITFKRLYDQGLIYQGERIINWDVELQTALSNIEVEHIDIPGKFYYFKYRFASHKEDYLTIATTRPETMFGDTAIVFNPHDKRYQKYSKEMLINPANGNMIPLLADRYVDMDFGTGVMKCTPAHDPNDFEIGKRLNLPIVRCMNLDGTMNEAAGEYQQLDRFTCRDLLVERINKEGNLVKIEEIVHSVGHSERSHTIVEPTLSKQWFVKMKPLAENVLELMKGEDKINFFPSRFEKIFNRWLSTTEDWCISRQLWWGHQIPIYRDKKTGEVICSITKLDEEKFTQDDDVLDTWFSSALSPFALMGWPDEENPYFKRYFPNSILITAYDIIFFWVARMAFSSANLTGKLPFKDCLIHGLIRDEQGRKMSKSLANGIDPLDIIHEYGTDTLRFAMITTGSPGLDVNMGLKNYDQARTFLNKIWNAARFVFALLPDDHLKKAVNPSELEFTDRYIYQRFNEANKEIIRNFDKYEMGQAMKYLYDFIYDDFCGNYLEFCKVELKTASLKRAQVIYDILLDLLQKIVITLFPISCFVSEEIYLFIPQNKGSIYNEEYPTKFEFKGESTLGSSLVEMIKYVRNFKAESGLAPSDKVGIKIFASKKKAEALKPFLVQFASASSYEVLENETELMRYFGKIGILVDILDSDEAKERIKRRVKELQFEIERSTSILSNENFIKKAPEEKVKCEREKLADYQAELERYKIDK